MSSIAAFGTAAATVLASGSVAALVSHFLTGQRERKALLRQKAEDLYVSIEEFENAWSIHALCFQRAVTGKITYNEYLDLWIEKGRDVDSQTSRRMEMLTQIYFPSTLGKLHELFKVRGQFSDIHNIYKDNISTGNVRTFNWKSDFEPVALHFLNCCREYKRAVVECAQKTISPLRP